MSKIGVIWCGWNCEEFLNGDSHDTLNPWINAYLNDLGGHEWEIAVVSVPFIGFEQPAPDSTLANLNARYQNANFTHWIRSDSPLSETEARGRALTYLTESECDWIIQADSDEAYTAAHLTRIAAFVDRSMATWFRLSLKNYVFDSHTYLTEPFTPPRIHRVDIEGQGAKLLNGGWQACGFWDDNNVLYRNAAGETKRDVEFAGVVIPKSVAWIPHLSWLNDSRSKRKIDYQLKGRGWPQCSFAWDDSKGGLIWNVNPPPETAQD